MHERSLVNDLMRRVEEAAGTDRVTRVRVRLGKLCHLSVEHLREHFATAAAGSAADGAELVIERGIDIADPLAGDLILQSVDVVSEVG